MKYTGNSLNEISFPLGGIGTGSVGLAGNGRLIDWEIYNRPDKQSINGYTHIAVRVHDGEKSYCRVLQGDLTKDLMGVYNKAGLSGFTGYGIGPNNKMMCGFPHFRGCEFDGEFPIAKIEFTDPEFPGKVTLTAFNPLIPLCADDSSIPAAFFEVEYENTGDSEVEFGSIFSLGNPFASGKNILSANGDITTVSLVNAEADKDAAEYGELALSCDGADEIQPYWYRGQWQDAIVTFWNEFTSGERLSRREYDEPSKRDHCSLGKNIKVAPGEKKTVRFVLSWYVPNCVNYWDKSEERKGKTWKNYYSKLYSSAAEAGIRSLRDWDDLYARTLEYKNTIFGSTLDPDVIDAAASNLSVIKTATVFRLENGEFYGWEGQLQNHGSCEGTCQHVYNYAYALCFLFPELERSIRNLEFDHCTFESGETTFRIKLPITIPQSPVIPCLDGQMGCVIKTYREWKISGDDEWLRRNWVKVKSVLEFAWSDKNACEWDKNKLGVLTGRQHHTLDMELFGPSSWLQGFYLAALRAASEMAEYLGEVDKAEEYLALYEKGREWTKENLFNDEYFCQKVDLSDKATLDHFGVSERYWNEETGEMKYQIGEGSAIDQLLGQWHADICGIGDIFDPEQVDIALRSMFKNNFKTSMRNFANPWRIFSINDDAGAVICDYPEGARKPKIPVPYCEETMHGFEYAFAGLLASRGYIEEGLTVVRSVRERYRGHNRNPWNEMECGSNYARSMASFALIPILSGFTFDLPHGEIGFDPKVNKNGFRSIFSLGNGWGEVGITPEKTEICLKGGSLELASLRLPYLTAPKKLVIDGKETEFEFDGSALKFEKTKAAKCIEII